MNNTNVYYPTTYQLTEFKLNYELHLSQISKTL